MRKKLKLSISRLEHQLELISVLDASHVLGGYSGGSGLANDASVDDILAYFSDLGFTFEADQNGNYSMTGGGNYQGSGIMIDEVTIMGHKSNEDDGSGSSYTHALRDYLFTFMEELDGSDGSDGSEIEPNLPGSGVVTTDPPPGGGNNNKDPWSRDARGNIIAERTTSPRFIYNIYGDNLVLEEYVIFTKSGAPIKAYKAVGVADANGNIIRQASLHEASNCMGYALTGGEYTFVDNPITTTFDEGKITRQSFSQWSGYTECSKAEATMVVIYSGTSSSSSITHAGIINADGTYSAKGGGGNQFIRTGMSESDFYKPYYPDANGEQLDYTPPNLDQIVYYKTK